VRGAVYPTCLRVANSRIRTPTRRRDFADIARRYDIDDIRVLHGQLFGENGTRRTSELLADVESLLIIRLQPFGNIQCTTSRTSRPGLRVHCLGDWPLKRSRFHDVL
jgi:hypothetical protein